MLEAAAINFYGGMFLTEDGNILIHDAARHADKIVLSALAKLRGWRVVYQDSAGLVLERQARP